MSALSRRRVGAVAASATALALCAPSAAFADSIGGTLGVSATVLSAALVTTTPIAFGNYNPGSATPTTSNTGAVTVTATTGTSYTMSLNAGSTTGATISTRQMSFGTNRLNYQVYTDAGRTTVWGDGTTGSTVTKVGNGLPQSTTAYGSMPAGQYATTGVYADTLTVTVTY